MSYEQKALRAGAPAPPQAIRLAWDEPVPGDLLDHLGPDDEADTDDA